MVSPQTIEGVIDQVLWFHYDAEDDVLYLRLARERETLTVSEETDDGFLLLRRQDDNQAVGLTIVNWWKRFGDGILPDSIEQLGQHIERFSSKIAA